MKPIKTSTIRPTYILILYGVLLSVVYLLGVMVPLFDNDSAHHALIGLRMYLTGNYVDLIDNGKDYLDKPHLLFWLSALGDKLFGVGTLAYKLPSLLFAVPGVYATYQLGKLLYSNATGRNAALILVTTQAYILAQNDVRMDALLTSLIITSTWLLYQFSVNHRFSWLLWGVLSLSLAFSTKGLSGVVVPLIAVLAQVLYSGNWSFLRSFKWVSGIPLFFLFSAPVIYCYYLQYDLHPEKIIRNMTGPSGVAFILFFQNIERMEGSNWGSSSADDPFFFFHTLLWALLPWCLLAYWAVYRKADDLWKDRFRYAGGKEIMTFATIVVMFFLLSISNFKLPHYLNLLFPFFAILISGQLEQVSGEKERKGLLITQKIVVVSMFLLSLFINLFLFRIQNWSVVLLSCVALVLVYLEWSSHYSWQQKLMGISVSIAIFANLLLNGNFYPQLQHYQAGHHIAEKVKELGIPPEEIRYYNWQANSFNYYSSYFYKNLDVKELGKSLWIVGKESEVSHLLDSARVRSAQSYIFQDFHTTKLKPKFLNPATRDEACETIVLTKINSFE